MELAYKTVYIAISMAVQSITALVFYKQICRYTKAKDSCKLLLPIHISLIEIEKCIGIFSLFSKFQNIYEKSLDFFMLYILSD